MERCSALRTCLFQKKQSVTIALRNYSWSNSCFKGSVMSKFNTEADHCWKLLVTVLLMVNRWVHDMLKGLDARKLVVQSNLFVLLISYCVLEH